MRRARNERICDYRLRTNKITAVIRKTRVETQLTTTILRIFAKTVIHRRSAFHFEQKSKSISYSLSDSYRTIIPVSSLLRLLRVPQRDFHPSVHLNPSAGGLRDLITDRIFRFLFPSPPPRNISVPSPCHRRSSTVISAQLPILRCSTRYFVETKRGLPHFDFDQEPPPSGLFTAAPIQF